MKYKSKNQQDFLASFFEEKDAVHSHKEINGFILEKTFNPVLDMVIIMVWKRETWDKLKAGN